MREGWQGVWGTEQQCWSVPLVCVGSELGCFTCAL